MPLKHNLTSPSENRVKISRSAGVLQRDKDLQQRVVSSRCVDAQARARPGAEHSVTVVDVSANIFRSCRIPQKRESSGIRARGKLVM